LYLETPILPSFVPGYGQTEATAGIAASVPGDYFSGSVGPPCLCAKVKLADVPEKNYFAKDGKGEICVKGPSVFQGSLHILSLRASKFCGAMNKDNGTQEEYFFVTDA